MIRFHHAASKKSYAIYRSPEDQYFATDGLCTHERIPLSGGLVMGDIIECPKHNGRFNYKTGQGKGAGGHTCFNDGDPARTRAGSRSIRLRSGRCC